MRIISRNKYWKRRYKNIRIINIFEKHKRINDLDDEEDDYKYVKWNAFEKICDKFTGHSASSIIDAAEKICDKYTGRYGSGLDDAAEKMSEKYIGRNSSSGKMLKKVVNKYCGISSPREPWAAIFSPIL